MTVNVLLVHITATNGLHVQCVCSEKSYNVYKNLGRMLERLSRFVHSTSLLSETCCAMGASKLFPIRPCQNIFDSHVFSDSDHTTPSCAWYKICM
jgi:hypothetical protein